MYNVETGEKVELEALDIADGFIFYKIKNPECDFCYNMVPAGEQPLPCMFVTSDNMEESDFGKPDFTDSQRKDAFATLFWMAQHEYGDAGMNACLNLYEGVI